MSALLKIANWNELFENNRTREMKTMAWVPIPNKLDGDGYTELLDHKNGPAHYAAWMACVIIASRSAGGCGIPAGTCVGRGTLLRSDKTPHDSWSLSRISRIPRNIFEEAIPRLLRIGWLESQVFEIKEDTETPQEGAGFPQEGALRPSRAHAGAERNGTERNGKKGTEEHSCSTDVEPASHFDRWWKVYPRKVGKKKCAKAHALALKGLALSRNESHSDAAEWLLTVTMAFAESPKGRSGQYCPHPETWLNQGRWDDNPAEWENKTQPSTSTSVDFSKNDL